MLENRYITEIREGDKIIRKEQSEGFQKRLTTDEMFKEYGHFVAMLYTPLQPLPINISPISLTRLIHLSTYICYDHNYLECTEHGKSRPINRIDTQKLTLLSERMFTRFWSEMIKQGHIIYKENKIYLCSAYFHRGRLDKDTTFMRLNIEGVQSLYQSCPNTSAHKYLSYIFRIIPWVNKYWNIVCSNPFERELDLIKPMKLSEYAELFDHDISNACRLCNTLTSFHFTWNHSDVQAFRYTTALNDPKKKWISIDPRLYYAGIDFKQAIKIAL